MPKSAKKLKLDIESEVSASPKKLKLDKESKITEKKSLESLSMQEVVEMAKTSILKIASTNNDQDFNQVGFGKKRRFFLFKKNFDVNFFK